MFKLDLGKMLIGIIEVMIQMWPIWVLGLMIIVFKLVLLLGERKIDDWLNKRKLKKYEKWGTEQDVLTKLKALHPKEFEEFVSFLFSKLGYKTKVVGGSNDGGIDVIAKKDGKTSYIQCKKYVSSKVSVSALRDFYGAIANKMANTKSFFITTNTFTLEAEKFAEDKPIELIDGFALLKYIKIAGILKEEIPKSNKTCPKCGGRLILRKSAYGCFYGCSNYPKCNFTRDCKKK